MDRRATVRRAVPADVPALLALEAHFPSDQMSRRSLLRFMANPRADFLVVEVDSRVLGNLLLLTRTGSRAARIYSLVIDPAARGMGLAQKLVQSAETAARERGCSRVTLEVRADNLAAQRLYGKLGYIVDRSLPAYYDDGADGLRLVHALHVGPEPAASSTQTFS